MDGAEPRHTVFDGSRRLMRGGLGEAALAVKAAEQAGTPGPLLIFHDGTGKVVDVDTRGTAGEVLARLSPGDAQPRGRGRPRLGVTAREVTLLPRHWEWLSGQPGGASATLRRLVEGARKSGGAVSAARDARAAAYAFATAVAGDLAGYEDAMRALFAGDRTGLQSLMADWPPDVSDHVLELSGPGLT